MTDPPRSAPPAKAFWNHPRRRLRQGLEIVYGTLLVGILVNLVSNLLSFPSIFDWITHHLLISGLIGAGLLLLTVLAYWEDRRSILATSETASSLLDRQNRVKLLKRVRVTWIESLLDQSLHRAAWIDLHLQEQPDALENPWRLQVQELGRSAHPLPVGTGIVQVYDETDKELLILGEPGSGKTTLLLQLARTLLDRALADECLPMPVVFNLSSWTQKQQSLTNWLREELETKYQVPKKLGYDWINADQILPLLDGLDEVDATSRTACMRAINEYHQTHSLVPLVVCCRVNEYMTQSNRLALDRAVTIQPLTTEQINEYFAGIGEQVASLRVAFANDPLLQELATTPLMLTILILAYQGSSLEEIEGGVSAGVYREQAFAMYTQRMMQRRNVKSRYSPQQTFHWLSYLAQQMKQQSQTIFYIERMQPTWLIKKWQRRLYYGLIVGPICGLLIGFDILDHLSSFPLTVLMTALGVGLLFGWLSEPEAGKKDTKTRGTWMSIRQSLATALENRLIVGVAAGLAIGISLMLHGYLADSNSPFGSRIAGALGYGLFNGIYMALSLGLAIKLERRIEPMEALSWSWIDIRRNIVKWLLIGIGIGSLDGGIFTLPSMIYEQGPWLARFLPTGLLSTFYFVLSITLVNGVTRGLSKRVLDEQYIATPNQGIWRSGCYGMVIAIIIGVITAVFAGAIDFMSGFWLPLAMGISIEPTPWDYSIVMMMSHILGFHPTTWQGFWTLNALFSGLVSGTILGLSAGLYCGGAAYVQHFVLRFLLWFTRFVPFNYSRFLDYAAERIFLCKVGGGYIFVHRLLLDYFADLEPGPVAREAVEREQEMILPVTRSSHQGTTLTAPHEIADLPTSPLSPAPYLLPCGHERRPNACYCSVCGTPVSS